MNVIIRQAKVEEAHTIAKAEREIARQPGFFCSLPAELTDENVANSISSSTVFLVAEYKGVLVGHAFLEPFHLASLQHVVELNIAVHPGWQRKGIGRKLLESIIEWAKKTDVIEKLQLSVRSANTPAISFYKKMGFQEEGRLTNKVKVANRYFDDILMGLDLTSHRRHKKPNEFFVRALQEDDFNTIVNTFCFPWSSAKATTDKWERYLTEQTKQVRTVFLVEEQGKIIGYASLLRVSDYPEFRKDGIPEINDLWIAEGQRKKGFGRKLILHLEEIARNEGYTSIGLGVGLYEDYGPAQSLYFKLGYVPDGKGITYKTFRVVPGEQYPVDDDLILWIKKTLST
jgi:ribosomal protein S18 acetylase RimI-like enzyme